MDKKILNENIKKNMDKYADIINMEHHVSIKHPKMPISDRAAQCAPFAALSGYEDSVNQCVSENGLKY